MGCQRRCVENWQTVEKAEPTERKQLWRQLSMLLGAVLSLPRGHTLLATTLRVLRSQTAGKSATRQTWLFTRFLSVWVQFLLGFSAAVLHSTLFKGCRSLKTFCSHLVRTVIYVKTSTRRNDKVTEKLMFQNILEWLFLGARAIAQQGRQANTDCCLCSL